MSRKKISIKIIPPKPPDDEAAALFLDAVENKTETITTNAQRLLVHTANISLSKQLS